VFNVVAGAALVAACGCEPCTTAPKIVAESCTVLETALEEVFSIEAGAALVAVGARGSCNCAAKFGVAASPAFDGTFAMVLWTVV
jgi:hypothetical protein